MSDGPLRYQRKPEIIEVMTFTGGRDNADAIKAWLEPYGFAVAYRPGNPGTNSAAMPAQPEKVYLADGPITGQMRLGERVVHQLDDDGWTINNNDLWFADYEPVSPQADSPFPSGTDLSGEAVPDNVTTASPDPTPPPPVNEPVVLPGGMSPPSLSDLPVPETGFPDDPPVPPVTDFPSSVEEPDDPADLEPEEDLSHEGTQADEGHAPQQDNFGEGRWEDVRDTFGGEGTGPDGVNEPTSEEA